MKIIEQEELSEMGIDIKNKEYINHYLTQNFYPPIEKNYKQRIIELTDKWMCGEISEDDEVDFLANGTVRWGDLVKDLGLNKIITKNSQIY